jgi:3-methyladenine DNA glycosylase AlkD
MARTRAPRPLVAAVHAGLAAAADPDKAPAMQRYMKSAMPYLGVPTPPLRRICHEVFERHPLADFTAWHDTVLALWRGATHREHRYAAIELASARRYRALQTTSAFPMYEEMIVSGAWWDYVDTLAHRLGDILRHEPTRTKARLRVWARSRDAWKRRAAILSQLGFKRETDLAFLHECIAPSMASEEFFLRKAIGWALRDLAWSDPTSVVRYVKRWEATLSPLTRREALKNVPGGPRR